MIREEALRLFAERGPDRVSLREVAAAAGVSAGLVVHHYGGRQGLRDAVDAHVAAVLETLFGGVDQFDPGMDSASFAQWVATTLPADSPIPAYLRRLLVDGGAAGAALFTRWLTASRAVLDHWVEAGMVRPLPDREVLAAFLMVNDLALFVLRDQLTEALGTDPLSPAGLARWVDTALGVYRDGLFTGAPPSPPPPKGRAQPD